LLPGLAARGAIRDRVCFRVDIRDSLGPHVGPIARVGRDGGVEAGVARASELAAAA
jgi:hypothetical protein